MRRGTYLPTLRNYSPAVDRLHEKNRDHTPLRDACDCFVSLTIAIALPLVVITLFGMWVNTQEKWHYREDGSLVLPYRDLSKEWEAYWEAWNANPPDWVKCRDSRCLGTAFMYERLGLGGGLVEFPHTGYEGHIPTYYNESTMTIHYLYDQARRVDPIDATNDKLDLIIPQQ